MCVECVEAKTVRHSSRCRRDDGNKGDGRVTGYANDCKAEQHVDKSNGTKYRPTSFEVNRNVSHDLVARPSAEDLELEGWNREKNKRTPNSCTTDKQETSRPEWQAGKSLRNRLSPRSKCIHPIQWFPRITLTPGTDSMRCRRQCVARCRLNNNPATRML
jgi:hypothetical protein